MVLLGEAICGQSLIRAFAAAVSYFERGLSLL